MCSSHQRQAAVHLGAIRTKTRTATARDVEVGCWSCDNFAVKPEASARNRNVQAFAGINYEELLTCLPEEHPWSDMKVRSCAS